MATQVEVAPVRDALQFAEVPLGQKWEGVLDVGRPARVMAQLVLLVFAQTEPLAGQSELDVPVVAPIAPELVPGLRLARMAEELDLHLLELA